MQAIQPTHVDDVLSAQEKALLAEALSGVAPVLLLRTKTRVDTGRWLRQSRLWLCMTAEEVLLFAISKRQYLQRIALSECKASTYCHTSGALLLQPTDHWRFNGIALSPTDGLKVLQCLEPGQHETQLSPVTEPTGA